MAASRKAAQLTGFTATWRASYARLGLAQHGKATSLCHLAPDQIGTMRESVQCLDLEFVVSVERGRRVLDPASRA